MNEQIIQTFGNKLRLRVSGIYVENDKILLIKHLSLGKLGYLWSPPGGGLNYGESVSNALKREFLEETGLEIEIEKFLFANEFMELPLHAIELFFLVKKTGGNLIQGKDPEMQEQIITEIAFLSFEQIQQENPLAMHRIFHQHQNFDSFFNQTNFLFQ